MELKDSFVGRLNGENFFRTARTETYVEVPPALLITDERGDTWSLGVQYVYHDSSTLEFNVIRNDVDTGETASKIVYRAGRVTIFGKAGRRTWNGRTFV